jgi:hypothetical protein
MADTGGVAPYPPQAVAGVLSPSRVISAQDTTGHDFFNVVRHLIRFSGAYRKEADQTDHLAAVSRFEANLAGRELRSLLSEEDVAPREDVSQRVPPAGQNVTVVPASVPAIDYGQLAAAILAAQKEQAAQAQASEEGQ